MNPLIIIPAETLQAEDTPAPNARRPLVWALWATAIALTGAHFAWVRAGMPGAAAINRALGIN